MSTAQGPNKKNPSKGKNISGQSISLKDRIQATIRTPQYEQDWATYNKNLCEYISKLPDHLQPQEGDILAEKPEDDPVTKKWNLPFRQAPMVFPYQQFSHYHNGERQCSCELIMDRAPRYLDIRVHLEAPVEDIRKQVMDLVNFFRNETGIKNRNPRPTKGVDIWKVYDMKIRDKKSLIAIARELWPKEILGNPTYDPKAKNRWEQISRAIKKATQSVRKVTEEAEKKKIPLRPHPQLYKNFF